MSPRPSAVAAVAALVVLAGAAGAQIPLSRVDIGQRAPDFTLEGADGHSHHLADYEGKVVVLEWMSPVCPFTELKYKSGAMQALQSQARKDGDVWFSINTADHERPGYLSATAAKARIEQTHATISGYLSDPEGKVGRLYGAKVTPTFFIIGPDGRLAYEGAMDDDPSVDDATGKNYVREALGDLAAHRPVKTPETRTYGCGVEY